jgi:hypothetical protein
MPTKMALWKVGDDGKAVPIEEEKLSAEATIESAIESAPELLGVDVLIVGRQVPTPSGPLDLLALDGDARLVVVENKRDPDRAASRLHVRRRLLVEGLLQLPRSNHGYNDLVGPHRREPRPPRRVTTARFRSRSALSPQVEVRAEELAPENGSHVKKDDPVLHPSLR